VKRHSAKAKPDTLPMPTPYQKRFVDHILKIYDTWNQYDPAFPLDCARELAEIDKFQLAGLVQMVKTALLERGNLPKP
jgi:hypothetical protein